MTNPYDLNPAVAAARAIMISQSRHRNTKEKPLTIREAAKRYTASKSAIGRHLKSMKLFGKPAFSDNSVGRPRNLDEAEERAVTAYIMWLERAGFPCNQLLIEEAANTLRASRTPPEGPVGNGWYRRFLADNPQLQKKKLVRAFDRERAGFEAGDINDLQDKLSEILKEGFTVHTIMNGFEKEWNLPSGWKSCYSESKGEEESLPRYYKSCSTVTPSPKKRDLKMLVKFLVILTVIRDSFSSPTHRLREEWKKNYKYDINNNGKPIHISFNRWKKWKQLDIVDEIIYIPPLSREASPNPERGFFYDTSGSAQQKRFYERLRDASAAGFYRSPLQDMPAVPSSDGVEISLGNSQRDAARDSLTFGDSDDSEDDEEAPEFVDLSQDIEEPELPPLPPPLPSFEQDFSSSYHRIMNILHPQRHTQ
ncbi:hypothetical protein ACKAV7_011890 [Fusarium commune]